MNSNASRKVAKAAASGRSSKVRKQIPLGYYSSIAAIVLAGVFVVGYSRYEKTQTVSSNGVLPAIGTKWKVAFGVDVCGTYEPNLPASPSSSAGGLYSGGNGLIEVAPISSSATGSNANLANFLKGEKGLKITSSSITLPNGKTVSFKDACGGRGAVLSYASWPSLLATTPTIYRSASQIKFQNDELVAVAVLPKGRTPSKPPSEVALVSGSSSSTSSSVVTSTTAVSGSKASTPSTRPSSTSATSSTVAG
jgi:hypothetical protein